MNALVKEVAVPVPVARSYASGSSGSSTRLLRIRADSGADRFSGPFSSEALEACRSAASDARGFMMRAGFERLAAETAINCRLEGEVVLEEPSLQLGVAVGTVGVALGVPLQPGVAFTGTLTKHADGSYRVGSVSGLDLKTKACREDSRINLLVRPCEDGQPPLASGTAQLSIVEVELFNEALTLGLSAFYPFRLASLGRGDDRATVQIFHSWAEQRVRGGTYPIGFGVLYQKARASGLLSPRVIASASWLEIVSRLCSLTTAADAQDLMLVLLDGANIDPLNIQLTERALARPLLRLLGGPLGRDRQVSPDLAYRLQAAWRVLRFFDLYEPDLSAVLFGAADRLLPQILTDRLVPIYRFRRGQLQTLLKENSERDAPLVQAAFYNAHPEMHWLERLLEFRYLRAEVAALREDVIESAQRFDVRLKAVWGARDGGYGPEAFELRLPGTAMEARATPARIRRPVALIENAQESPWALRAVGEDRGEFDVYASLPDAKRIRAALARRVLIDAGRSTVFWMNRPGVWPPSIDAFHVVRYLDFPKRPFVDTKAILDLGAGTGILGIHAARTLPHVERLILVEEDPLSAVFAALNVAWNLGDVRRQTSAQAKAERLRQLMSSLTRFGNETTLERDGRPYSVTILRGDAVSLIRSDRLRRSQVVDLLLCAPPYLPQAHLLSPSLWRAVAGTDLLEAVVEHGLRVARRIIVQYSRIALSAAQAAYERLRENSARGTLSPVPDALPACLLGTVAFKIPPIASFFLTEADDRSAEVAPTEEVPLPPSARRLLESFDYQETLRTWRDVKDAGWRTGGFRFHHDLLLTDLGG